MIRSTLFATAAALMVSGVAYAAPVAIDDFTTFQGVAAPTLPSPGLNPDSSTIAAAEAIGGVRTITATRTAPAGGLDGFGKQVQAVVDSGSAGVAAGISTEGHVEFTWDAGAAYDLVDGTNDRVDVIIESVDLTGTTYSLSLDGVMVTKAATVGTLSFYFSEFGAEDGSSVDSISLMITGPASFDTSFSFIGAVPPAPVPLPAAAGLALAGLGALGALRARRQK